MKSVSYEDLYEYSFLSQPHFSPKGRHFCFVVTKINKETKAYESRIYEKKGKVCRALTNGGKERAFQFLNEDTILFPGNREAAKGDGFSPESRYYTLSLKGGEAVLAHTFPIPVNRLIPLTNGDFLALGTVFPGFERLYTGDKKIKEALCKKVKEEADYEVVTQVPFWWNGDTFHRGSYTALYYYDAKKKKLSPLTEEGVNVGDVKLSPDESYVLFNREEQAAVMQLDGMANIWKLSLSDRTQTCLVDKESGFFAEHFFFCDSFILVAGHHGETGLNSDCDFYRMTEDGSLTPYASWGNRIGSTVGSDVRFGGGYAVRTAGDTAYFIGTENEGSYLYRLENGAITRITEKEGSVDSFDLCDDRILTIGMADCRPQEICDEKGNILTNLNGPAIKNRYIAIPRPFSCMSAGHEVRGFVMNPKDYSPEKTYPVILDVHGGPKTIYGSVFMHEMQLWAGMGYFVIYCNPTGSDGRGTFSDIRGRYGTVDYDDLMAFTDAFLAATPSADAQNLFETGGSYGGFMTNWIIGHTDRFKACASQRSISNWFSFYGISDIGPGFAVDQNAADPWESPAALWDRSPLKYADEVKTPTLFIHSFEDYRCPIDQGYQMYTALAVRGIDTRMVLFRGENHELSRSGKPEHRLRRLKEITEWFEKYRNKE